MILIAVVIVALIVGVVLLTDSAKGDV